MARYDEDLHENLFFQTLVNRFAALFNEAAENRWLIFVPRADSASRLRLLKMDFENHVVKPVTVEGAGHFLSVNGKSVVVEGSKVMAGQGYKEPRVVNILFEECFFNSREESYQVFCVDQPLEGALSEEVVLKLENVDDCNKFLWGDVGSEKVRRSVDRLMEMFYLERGSQLRQMVDASAALYTRAIQEVFKLKKFQPQSQRAFCKLAVETYVLASVHRKIFKDVCFKLANKDAVLNKITRNLSDVTPKSLGIRQQFEKRIPKARAILSQLNQFATPLEKLFCFKQCVCALMEGGQRSEEPMTADELLPALVYLVSHTDIPNWLGNLTYITKFHFSHVASEEFTYYLTSFEAAVEFVRSEALKIGDHASDINKVTVPRIRSASLHEEVDGFFVMVCRGDVEGVRVFLEREKEEAESLKSRLCHPLCSCPTCTELLDKQLDNPDHASVFSRDENGRTGLHHAARLGNPELVSLLLEYKALLSATDHHSSTPLHLACQKGHQPVTLLLLGEGASVNASDNHGNTPLHLACSNGHEECVKALLFNKVKCDINLTNDQGDSPLHNAARWGYSSIVSVLLGHGATTGTLNRRRESAAQCAQSGKVQQLLSEAQKRHSVAVMEEGSDSSEGTPVLKVKHVTRRMSVRDSISESDRQLKKLFRAVQDGDTNYVKYLFGWEEGVANLDKLCHPLCQCERCSQLRKSPPVSNLSLNCCDHKGLTPLHKASLLGHTKMVQLLLAHSAFPDVKTKETLQTPLHLACQYNQKDVVMVLLENQASVTEVDHQGNTALHLSCSNGHLEAAVLLLIHGADVTMTNARGNTPLHNAARWNHPLLVQELMLYGAQYRTKNYEGKTPLELTTDDEVQLLIVKAIKGELPVGQYLQPMPVNHQTPPTNKKSSTPLFQVDEEAQLFSPLEEDHTPFPRPEDTSSSEESQPSVTVTNHSENFQELLRAIENFDRRGTLKRTSTIDRSAPFLTPSDAIQVPNSPTKVEEEGPGGSWDCVDPPPQGNPVVLGKSWDCVGEADITRTQT